MVTLQQQVAAWLAHNFPASSVKDAALVLGEEAGEVNRAIVKRDQGIRGTYEHWTEELHKEAADAFIAVYAIAVQEGFDLDEAVRQRWEVVRQRDFRR